MCEVALGGSGALPEQGLHRCEAARLVLVHTIFTHSCRTLFLTPFLVAFHLKTQVCSWCEGTLSICRACVQH